MLLATIATAHPIAAPTIPIRGINSRSRPTLRARATAEFARFHDVRPKVIRTRSTSPQALPTSIAPVTMIIEDRPDW